MIVNKDYSEDLASRGINTAATDTKSWSNTAERKRTGKSSGRRKRKNVQIRKLTKKSNKLKKSTKSLVKHGTESGCIHEKVEEENEVNQDDKPNKDLMDIEVNSNCASPEKRYAAQDVVSIRNNSIVNNSSTYNNKSMLNIIGGKREKKKLSSLNKPVNDNIIVQK